MNEFNDDRVEAVLIFSIRHSQ